MIVIVFTCNRPDDLKRCLASVFRQSYMNFEVMVVDNSDNLHANKALKDYSIKLISDKTKKLSYLFNLGWKNASAENIAYLADDVEISDDWLEKGMSTFKRQKPAAVVTGPLLSPFEYSGEMHALYSKANKSRLLSIFARFYDNFILAGKTLEPCVLCESGGYTIGQGLKPDFSEEREVDLATTSGMLIKRSAIEKIGGFDENFYFNHADGDLFIRLKQSGYRIIYNPRMRAVHFNRMGP
ncbi:glycosyltransferase family 2 protein, partial [Patescibacteria group bacterium]|nr:glycosyltransferase family 2 protein [Patescibacteria group bacterium]